MKHLQYVSGIAIGIAVLAGTVLGDGKLNPGRAPPARIDTADLPGVCHQFLSVFADSRSETLPWEQRLSVAACRQQVTVQPTSRLADFPAMLARIDRAMQPSATMYRDAIAHGPTAQIQMLGAYGLGMTYVDTIVMARNAVSVPAAYGGATYGTSLDPSQQRHLALEFLLMGYRMAGQKAFRDVVRLANDNPATARANPVMVFIVQDARRLIDQLGEAPSTVTEN